ncbi:MAG: capsule assembly Wzi family protein [Treponema sp.]|nr:capsule assembly Wzi family protein [Treponema sp.]
MAIILTKEEKSGKMNIRNQESGIRNQESGIRNQESGIRKSKKSALVLFFVTVLFCLTFNLSAQNHQKIIPIDSEIYVAIKALYIAHGLALPSTAGPWSEDELLLMLSRLDQSKLKGSEQGVYDFAYNELTKDEQKSFRFTGTVTTEVYAHTNTTDFIRTDDYIRPMNLTQPFLALNVALRITDFGYGTAEFSIGNEKFNASIAEDGTQYTSVPDAFGHTVGSTFFGTAAFGTNIPMVPPGTLNDLNFNFPSRAFVSVGSHGWNIEAGRERLSWGPGESGNFLVGSHVDYHNNIRTTFYNNHFKYVFNVSGFPSPDEYYGVSNDNMERITDTGINHLGLNLFIAHRLEWRLFNKLNMALSEAIMYQPEDTLDMQYFLPTIVLHNLYRRHESNSLLTLEADYALMPRLNIYGQLAVDEFHLPGEPVPGTVDDVTPDAFGFMLGAKTAFSLWNGMVSASVEAAYTDPYLYLRAQDFNAQANKRELNYVVANRYISMPYSSTSPLFVEEFLGYRWGGDAIAFNAQGAYRDFGAWNVGVNALFMIHGTFDKWTRWSAVDQADNPNGWDSSATGDTLYANRPGNQSTPTDHHYQANYADTDVSDRNAPSYLTALSLFGSYKILAPLQLYGQVDMVTVANKGNIKGKSANDIQITVGMHYQF